jgi:FKBP-type peptidyl-prolyl cis-trans isomerase FklB
MKTIVLTAIFSLTVAAPLLGGNPKVLKDDNSRTSYAMGMMLGQRWKASGVTNLNYSLVLRGLKDAVAGGSTLLTEQEMRNTLLQYQQKLAKEQEARRQELVEKNLKASEAFLAKNKKQKGVVTLPDGLQYKVIADGSGPSPTADDTVTVSYEGTLIDGTKFDSSDKVQFHLGDSIRGWSEAITHMKVGSEWQLYVPPDLAYGARGRPPKIGPDSVLIFKVKLLSIDRPKPVTSNIIKPVTSDIIEVPSAEEMAKGAKVQIIKPEEVTNAQAQHPQLQTGK